MMQCLAIDAIKLQCEVSMSWVGHDSIIVRSDNAIEWMRILRIRICREKHVDDSHAGLELQVSFPLAVKRASFFNEAFMAGAGRDLFH
jgi:hypothetical protein